MARTASNMLALGTQAPDFSLPATHGSTVSLEELSGSKGLVVAFICNHCPDVIHLRGALASFGAEAQAQGLAMVAISSNDVENYPQDSPELMGVEAREAGYTFPYLYDATQEVARAYKAACTPDFYLFDAAQRLVYRGQFDGSRPGNDVLVDGTDLRRAVSALLNAAPPIPDQRPSLGCNIKWKPGSEG